MALFEVVAVQEVARFAVAENADVGLAVALAVLAIEEVAQKEVVAKLAELANVDLTVALAVLANEGVARKEVAVVPKLNVNIVFYGQMKVYNVIKMVLGLMLLMGKGLL